MSKMVIEPRIRGYICLNAHPEGCKREVERQIKTAWRPPSERPGGNLMVVGSSTGYGLASRITGAFRYGMDSVGVFYERPPKDDRTASAGWYNTAAFSEAARAEGLKAIDINGDAFSQAVLDLTLGRIRDDLGPLDALVYSVAAPARTDPETGDVHRSHLKPIGEPLHIQSIDLATYEVGEIDIEPASEAEIDGTVRVMGGIDLRRWVEALLEAGLLAERARIVAYSYIGPDITWPIYHHGTIGRAKAHLAATCADLDDTLRERLGGSCHVAVNKSVVTQAAAAIPALPLYIGICHDVMRKKGIHEGTIEQMVRLFDEHLGTGDEPAVDEGGFIRLDDLEMRPDVQAEVHARWERLTPENMDELADFETFRTDFRNLFGFDVPGVDYSQPVEVDVPLEVPVTE